MSSAADFLDPLALGINRYTDCHGRIYFKLECFLTTSNIANPLVLSAFREAASQIRRCLAAHNVQLSSATHEVVVVLQCLSLTQPQFYYYVVDHDRGQIADTYAHSEGSPGAETGSYVGPTQSVAEYWDHVVCFPTHRPCTQSVYDDAHKLAQELVLKSTIQSSGNINPEIPKMLNVFERNKIDMYATFSIAKAMVHIFEISAKQYVANEVSPRPTLVQSLMGFFSTVIGSGEGGFESECDEPDPDHPLVHDDFPDISDSSTSGPSNFTPSVRRRTGWNNNE